MSLESDPVMKSADPAPIAPVKAFATIPPLTETPLGSVTPAVGFLAITPLNTVLSINPNELPGITN